MQIEKVKLEDIIEYNKNAKRHTKKQIEHIKNSITQFGFNDPIAIDENNVIIEGHGRLQALKELGYTDIEVIRLTHLNEEQKKAYILAHNKLNMETGFDSEILFEELDKILEIDMGDFGFNIDDVLDDVLQPNQRQRTNDAYNLDLVDISESTNDFWQMPIIKNDNYIPNDLIGFNYAKTSDKKDAGIHFYLDDYQFERVWNNPEKYIETLRQYECVLSPDFSLYMDMPMSMKIWNIYRSRQIGKYWQDEGIKVIPTLSWAEKETFEFCFKGIPKSSIVSVSTIGVKKDKKALKIWNEGMDAMIQEIQPSTILVYGGKLDYDYGNIEVKYFENKVTEKLKKE